MSWKHRTIGFDESYERIRDGVELLALKAGECADVFLFTRTTADRRGRVLLLSPLAVELAGDALGACWVECEAPELFEWDLVIGPPDGCDRLGLRRPRFGRARDASPPFTPGGEQTPR